MRTWVNPSSHSAARFGHEWVGVSSCTKNHKLNCLPSFKRAGASKDDVRNEVYIPIMGH